MRRQGQIFRIIVLTLILILGLTIPSHAQEIITTSKSILDIDEHWASEQITEWIDLGFIEGYEDGSFKPDNSITRAEFATLTNKALDVTETAPVEFADVTESDWYYDEIAKAVAQGYLSGYEDGTVRPNDQITRAEAAAVIAKALDLSGEDITNLDEFTDANAIADWAKPYISLVLNNDLMGGYPDGSFKATNNITRAESVTLLDRVYQEQDINYDEAGTYGPITGIETFKKDVNINVDGVTLENMLIEGNLYLRPGIGEGDAYLNNVTVTGQTIVEGGGNASIYLTNFNGEDLIVKKIEGPVRIVILESSVIENISLETDSRIEIPEKAVINTIKATSKAEIDLESGSKVTVLILDAETVVTGEGQIENAEINVEGVTLETPPENLKQAEGITTEIAGKKVTDGVEEEPIIDDSEDDEWYPPAPINFTYDGDREIWVIFEAEAYQDPVVTDANGNAVDPILITYKDGDQVIEVDEVLINEERTYTLTYKEDGYNELVLTVVITKIEANTFVEKDFYEAGEELEFEISGLKPDDEVAVNMLIHTGKPGGPPWAFGETVLDNKDEVHKANEEGIVSVKGTVQPDLSKGHLQITLPDYLCYIDNSITLENSNNAQVYVGYPDLTYEGQPEIHLRVGEEYTAPKVTDKDGIEVTPDITNEADETFTEIKTDEVETYILTYSAEGYKKLVIVVRVSAVIEVGNLEKSYYATGDELEFTISGLNAEEDVIVGMPIFIGSGGNPWASGEKILNDMSEEEEDGRTIRYWLGETDEEGNLLVKGIIQKDLPSGALHITLPDYGYVINNAIRLEDEEGNSVRVGAPIDFTYEEDSDIWIILNAPYFQVPEVTDADGKEVTPVITNADDEIVNKILTSAKETYKLTYKADGYNNLAITVKVTDITVSKLTQEYYSFGDTLEFEISELKPDTEVWVGMPIGIESDESPWASGEEILDNMHKEEQDGRTIRHWIGTTDNKGILSVSGTVQPNLPDGILYITLPDYFCSINNPIMLQYKQGSVFVGPKQNFRYDAQTNRINLKVGDIYDPPYVTDAVGYEVDPIITNLADETVTEVKTDKIETYRLTYETEGYNDFEIFVRVAADIIVGNLEKSYYAPGDTLEFTIKDLNAGKETRVGMPIFVGPGGNPWASGEKVLKNMEEREEYGRKALYWVGTTDENGELLVSGIVESGLTSGELHITLPDYGYVIDNAIRLQHDPETSVRVGDQQ